MIPRISTKREDSTETVHKFRIDGVTLYSNQLRADASVSMRPFLVNCFKLQFLSRLMRANKDFIRGRADCKS